MSLTESQVKMNPGDKSPDFSLQGTDGKTHSLDSFSGKEGYLIVFMCNHCPYVIAKTDALNALQEKFGDKIAIIGINSSDPAYPGEGMDKMKAFVEEKGLQFPYLLDDAQTVAKAYGAVCTPDPFLFDKEGKLVFHGRINNAMQPEDTATEDTMGQVISQMLAGEAIDPELKPSMGCSIKWIE